MKTHFAEEFDDATQFNETAEEHVWHEHRLTPGSRLGNIAAVALLVAALLVFLKLSIPATQPTPALGFASPAWIEQGFEMHGGAAAPEAGDERERVR
jgi:hypothetical protein